jgi:hypothetical protein
MSGLEMFTLEWPDPGGACWEVNKYVCLPFVNPFGHLLISISDGNRAVENLVF